MACLTRAGLDASNPFNPFYTVEPRFESEDALDLIPLDTMDAKRALHVEGAGAWKGGVFRVPASAGWKIRNDGQVAVQVMTAVAVRH